ncbi:signal peptidase I [Rossellomorea sp. SC111]|uniref:signal peptidase I n=1 Tax=Rossellomorea sp. SC111 TaxID=2968985 RepID=UPI00215A322E|nr:signal peptidase I [Rossellomorea sp. SC111]MCR8850546.1 signal peptidase I [Rossellomorea sp. SC111]
MKRKMLKMFTYLLSISVLCCIVFLLFVSYQAQQNPSKIPSFFGYKPLTVLTNSMEPKISAGDMVFVKEKDAMSVKEKEIITFRTADQKVVTHRVVDVTPEGFLTKGDNNNVEDSWKVKPDSLIGEVAVILPNAGYVAKFISSKIGFSLFVLLPFLLFILIEVFERTNRYFNRKEDTASSKV